jgi:hypothetical protein
MEDARIRRIGSSSAGSLSITDNFKKMFGGKKKGGGGGGGRFGWTMCKIILIFI